jgi:hypothetical protein
MTPLDADTVFDEDDYQPPARPNALEISTADGRWGLPDEAFVRWWRCLPEEDRGEFISVYGGDNTLARFVCALDYLTIMQARPQSGATIVEAYAIAASVDAGSETARSGASRAWKSDAVQALLDRLRYRSNRQAAARITNKTTVLIEQMLAEAATPEVELKDKANAAKTALAFMRMVSDEDVQERVERTKRGFVKARAELSASQDEVEHITPDQALLHTKVMIENLGEEGFLETVRKALAK